MAALTQPPCSLLQEKEGFLGLPSLGLRPLSPNLSHIPSPKGACVTE